MVREKEVKEVEIWPERQDCQCSRCKILLGGKRLTLKGRRRGCRSFLEGIKIAPEG